MSSDDSANAAQRPLLTLTFPGNFAPMISPSNEIVALTNIPAPLAGSVTNAAGSAWSQASRPGAVNFADATIPATTATFSTPGNYSLRLTASNSLAQVSRDLNVTVATARPQLGSLLNTSNRF